ncbi:PblB [Streptococcus pneumoniae]|nr:PblB [Streptococcus pneumoniae]
MGRISDQVSANKANADSQFANVTNQLARKVETTDFQRVKETSKLYERILGNTENGIADKVARMALTNQLFQVEVAKNASNGQNLLKGTKDFSGGWKNKGANWKKHAEKYKGVDVLFKNNSWNGVGQEIDAKIGEVYTFSLWMKSDWKNDTVNFYVNRNGSVEKGWGVPSETSVAITSEWKRYSFTFKITVDGFIFPRVERLNQNTNLYIAGLKLEKGSYATPYTEAPEDTDEAIRSVQSQLTGSWAVQNINSAGDIISGINLGANGHNRFVGKLTHITGETLIDRAVIKSAMVDKLKTGNFEAGSVTTTILDAEAVTAEKLKVDNALIRKLTANDAFIDQLISKRIFSIKVESVISSSTFLEAYQGRIGGFTLGQFDQGGGRWISMESGQPSGRTGEIIGTMPDLKHGTSILMGKCTVGMKSVFMIKWIFRIHREQTSMGILLFLVLLCFQMVSNLEVKMCLVMVGIPKAEGMRLFGGIRSVAVA